MQRYEARMRTEGKPNNSIPLSLEKFLAFDPTKNKQKARQTKRVANPGSLSCLLLRF
jgi:hypothetical protein